MAETSRTQRAAQQSTTKTFENAQGQRVELDPNDPATAQRVAAEGLREVPAAK